MKKSAPENPLLAVRNLQVSFETPAGQVNAVRNTSFNLHAGECLGLVGESGSGKSQAMLAILGLLDRNGTATGSAMLQKQNLLTLPEQKLAQVRGRQIGMIFQDPLASMTPHMSIGSMLGETLIRHGTSRDQIHEHSLKWLKKMHIPNPARRLEQFPHELSGGMRQRVMIAAAMACKPKLLIADEPTTALDVTVQAEILELMSEIKRQHRIGLIFITHDMGVVARICDQVAVMQHGRLIEQNTVNNIFASPQSDHTRMLIETAPRLLKPSAASPPPQTQENILEIQKLHVRFPLIRPFAPPAQLHAVNGISFYLKKGETLGVVGESGCGKTSLARAVLRLINPASGQIVWLGKNMTTMTQKQIRPLRHQCQIVFQDPLSSLNPRMKAAQSVAEPLHVSQPQLSTAEKRSLAIKAMQKTGLDPELADRYPHQLSGGQNQRLGIARAMISKPSILVCDEAVSALDVSVQSRILSLLREIQRQSSVAILFISHDLSVVKDISHRVMVIYLGQIVETAPREQLFANPRHPYTQALMAASPQPDPELEKNRPRSRNETPPNIDPLFRFLPSRLHQQPPRLVEISPGHWAAEHDAFKGRPGLYLKTNRQTK